MLLIETSPGECKLFHLALVQAGLDAAAAFYFLEDHVHHFDSSSKLARLLPQREA